VCNCFLRALRAFVVCDRNTRINPVVHECSWSTPPFPSEVDVNRSYDDRADDNVLDVGGHLDKVQPVAENAEHEDAHQRRADASDSTTDSAAADDHRGNRVQLLNF